LSPYRTASLLTAILLSLTGAASGAVTDGLPTGPKIGERMPAFTLPDQNGNPVTFSPGDGKGRALILFHRSASW
jgi:cytochrome oxidase Cu insertion factor (SCO1/SenC/PrrC family)